MRAAGPGALVGILLTVCAAASRAQHLQGALDWRSMGRDGDTGSAEDENARLVQVVRGGSAQ